MTSLSLGAVMPKITNQTKNFRRFTRATSSRYAFNVNRVIRQQHNSHQKGYSSNNNNESTAIIFYTTATNGKRKAANSGEFVVTLRPQVRWASSSTDAVGAPKVTDGEGEASTALVIPPSSAVVVPEDLPVDLEAFFTQHKKEIEQIQAHYKAKLREEQKEMAKKIAVFPWKVVTFPVRVSIRVGNWAKRKFSGEKKDKTEEEKEDKKSYDTNIQRYFQGQDVCRNLKVEECVFEKGTDGKKFSEMIGKNYYRYTKGLSEWLPHLSFVIAPSVERAPVDDEKATAAAARVVNSPWHLNVNNGVITVRDDVDEDTFEAILLKIGPQANQIRKALERNLEETVKLQLDVLDRVKVEKLEAAGVDPLSYQAALHTILQAPWYFRKHLKSAAVKLDPKAANPRVDVPNLVVILPAALQRHCMHRRYQRYRRIEAILKAMKPYRFAGFLILIWMVGDLDF